MLSKIINKKNQLNDPEISIVIPFFNEEKVINKLLESIIKLKSKISIEVILVNNNSTDKSMTVIKNYQKRYSFIKLITETEQGIGAARKKGFLAASGKIIASTDADVQLPVNWLDNIYSILKEKEYVGIVGTYIFSDKANIFNFIYRSLMIFFDHVHRFLAGGYAFRGLNFAIKKEAYMKSGGFNSKISALEDVDLSQRVKNVGKIKYSPEITVITSYRRFKGRFLSQLIKRLKSYYSRVFAKNNKNTDWDIIR